MAVLDFDRWAAGRDESNKFNVERLKSAYPYIKVQNFKPFKGDWDKIRKILTENIEEDIYGLKPYMTMGAYLFFQDKGERDLVETLRLIY